MEKIFYICDGKVPECKKKLCFTKGKGHPCRHTTDISHAVNFRQSGRNYYEKKKLAVRFAGQLEKYFWRLRYRKLNQLQKFFEPKPCEQRYIQGWKGDRREVRRVKSEEKVDNLIINLCDHIEKQISEGKDETRLAEKVKSLADLITASEMIRASCFHQD